MIKLAIELMGWLKINWLPMVIFATFVTYSLLINNSAYDRGYNTADIKWKMDIQAAKDEAIEKANEKSKELETALAGMRDKNRKLNRDLANEIKINRAAYDNCIVSPSVVQLWNTSTKTGDSK